MIKYEFFVCLSAIFIYMFATCNYMFVIIFSEQQERR